MSSNKVVYDFCIQEDINLVLSQNYHENDELAFKLHALHC